MNGSGQGEQIETRRFAGSGGVSFRLGGSRYLLAVLGLVLLAGCGRTLPGAASRQLSVVHPAATLTWSLEADRAEVADGIDVQLEIAATELTRVTVPSPPARDGDWFFEATPEETVASLKVGDVWRQRWRLKTFQPGRLAIPDLVLGIDSGGTQARVRPPNWYVQIESAAGPLEHFLRPRLARDPIGPPRTGMLLTLVTGVGCLLCLFLVGRWLVGSWRRQQSPARVDRWAASEIERLDRERLEQRWDEQRAAAALFRFLNEYLRRRLGVSRETETAATIAAAMEADRSWAPSRRAAVMELLAATDAVRFARYRVSLRLIRQLFRTMREAIGVSARPLPQSGSSQETA